jgi:His/Glu/Gln/Arg/opine family amino acid ABC transporter permease subunit
MQFDFSIVLESMPMLLKGALVTLQLSFAAIVLGTLGGFVLAFFRLSKVKVLDWPTRVFINLMRGIPFLIQIFIVYYGIASLGFKLPAIASGVLVMALNTAAFQAEIMKAGIVSIPAGQREAASALGMSKFQTAVRIVIPQVFIKVLPSVTNELIILLKNSSLLSVIAIIELFRVGQRIVGSTYQATEIYITVAILYLVMNLLIAQAARYLERRTAIYR